MWNLSGMLKKKKSKKRTKKDKSSTCLSACLSFKEHQCRACFQHFLNQLQKKFFLETQILFVRDIWPYLPAVGCIYNGMTEEFVPLQTSNTNKKCFDINC